jgi:hypothetical protein
MSNILNPLFKQLSNVWHDLCFINNVLVGDVLVGGTGVVMVNLPAFGR